MKGIGLCAAVRSSGSRNTQRSPLVPDGAGVTKSRDLPSGEMLVGDLSVASLYRRSSERPSAGFWKMSWGPVVPFLGAAKMIVSFPGDQTPARLKPSVMVKRFLDPFVKS